MSAEQQERLFTSILEADMAAARSVMDAWTARFGFERTVQDLLAPVLERIGVLWEQGADLNLAQCYMAAKITEESLLRNLPGSGPPAVPDRGPVLLGSAENDFHSLGRRMVAAFLRAAHWSVVDLGNDVSAEAFVDAAVQRRARIVGVSAMTYGNARNILAIRQAIDRRNLGGRLQLAVGGAVFLIRKELAAEVGADGTAANALRVPALFDSLWTASLRAGPAPGPETEAAP